VQARLKELAGSKLTAGGDILIIAGEHRTQEQNRRAARERLTDLIARAERPPKRRTPTRPSGAAKQRRIDDKKRRARLKRVRREHPED
jgi:ribosome-associated protein